MKVILTRDVPNVGLSGEVKEVAPGYARNYLIPKGLAVEATPGRLKELKMREEAKVKKAAREVEEARKIAEKIDGKSFTVKAKSGERGRLFGSITSADIAKVLQAYGVSVDKKKIELKDPLKELGSFDVEIKLNPEVSARITVLVEPEE